MTYSCVQTASDLLVSWFKVTVKPVQGDQISYN